MVFSSLLFIYFFLPIFFLLYFIIKNRKYRNTILLLFSLFFYAYGEPVYILLMVLSIVANYYLAILIDKYRSKKIFVLDIAFNLGLIAVFKYFNFFLDNINNLFNLNINFINIVLPIGISFYTFQIMTYVIDVYKKEVPVQKNIILLGCYICSFPQLIAGPIVRYSTVNEELKDRKENLNDIADGARRFILGLSKKVLIANGAAFICEHILFLGGATYGFIGALLIAVSYTIQIYFDFSGYSDMAIGLGRILGFHYLENFNYPYIASSITDFWRRWHISLSSFFKDYVYIPLGGNRVKKILNIRNLIIVWALTGLWHGASWNFIFWGLYYGIILIIEKFLLKDKLSKIPKLCQHIYALILIVIGWVIFLSVDLATLKDLLSSLIGMNGLGKIHVLVSTQTLTVRYMIPLVLGIIFSMPIYPKIKKALHKNSYILDILLVMLLLLSSWIITVDSYNPFIYFRF